MLKIVQIDLARQMETISAIYEFIDLAAKHYYNALLFYLEDRIKTPSYPYPADNETYSIEEMKTIVRYAAQKGLEIIPCVPVMGHAERFLRHKEMLDLAELRGGETNRYGAKTLQEYCPMQQKLYDFLEKYFTELAEIFPSQYFHIGQDEIASVGKCPVCSKIAAEPDGESRLITENTLKAYKILKKLNKRPMIWADMLEEYKDIADKLPKDTVIVDWQYQSDAIRSVSHFANLEVTDNLKIFRDKGFDVICAPTTSASNIRTFTEYAAMREVSGMLLTNWERAHSFQPRLYPVIAYAGELWNGSSHTDAIRKVATSLFGIDDQLFSALLDAVFDNGMCTRFAGDRISADGAATTGFFGRKSKLAADLKLFILQFGSFRSKIKTETGIKILDDILLALESAFITQNVRNFFSLKRSMKWDTGDDETVNDFLDQLDRWYAKRKKFWSQIRPGIDDSMVDSDFHNARNSILTLAEKFKSPSPRLSLRFAIPNQWGCEFCTISLKKQGKWEQVTKSVFKSLCETTDALFEKTLFLPADCELENLKLEFYGFGGTGVCYAEIETADGSTYIPTAVTEISGKVLMAENMLINSAAFAWFGDQHILFTDADCKEKSAAVHSVVLKMDKTV